MTDLIKAENASSSHDDSFCLETFPNPMLIFGIVSIFVMSAVGTLANGLTIAALIWCKSTRRPSVAIVISLFFAELLFCVVILPLIGSAFLQILYYGEVRASQDTVVIIGNISRMLDQVVLHNIAAIAFYRLIAVWFPHFYKRMKTSRAVSASVVAVWGSSLLAKLPISIQYTYGYVRFCKTQMRFKVIGSSWMGIYFSMCYVLPVLFISAAYVGILRKIALSRRLYDTGHPGENLTSVKERGRQPWRESATKSVLVVSTMMFVCSTPHCIMHALEPYPGLWDGSAWIVIHLIYFIQFTADPVIYIVMNAQYRKALSGLVDVLLCRSSQLPFPSMGSSYTPSQRDTQTQL
ncbi:G-protein coupled receptor moody-like [Oratosquilla oratoria]|uniref:G-protein coupled receptor moody-like n=1 Tax=Oratosquilla oratoria TaxID=337810 RepID=UPI003F76CEE1